MASCCCTGLCRLTGSCHGNAFIFRNLLEARGILEKNLASDEEWAKHIKELDEAVAKKMGWPVDAQKVAKPK